MGVTVGWSDGLLVGLKVGCCVESVPMAADKSSTSTCGHHRTRIMLAAPGTALLTTASR